MTRARASRLMLASVVLAGLTVYASTFVISYGRLFYADDPLWMTDVARLTHARVTGIAEIANVEDIRSALRDARRNDLKVSIAGARHSQGGHAYSEGAIVLDMRGFNEILSIDRDAMSVTVESGATWDELQRALAPQGLALKVMQSSNVFTVGGSLSANAHGRDINVTQMLEVVESFRLMLADGSIVEVDRDTMPELFSLVIGGYGLYGVILDVTLHVTRDEIYAQQAAVMNYAQFPDYFSERIREDRQIALMIARPSIDPDAASFLEELVVVTWRRSARSEPGAFELVDEQHVLRDRFFFSLSRRFDWAKSLRWHLQKQLEPTLADSTLISRNNAMRPPTAPLEFLDYYSARDTDILQEYFVPVTEFVPFMDGFREILTAAGANVLSVTVRFVGPDASPALPYVPTRESFSIVVLINVGLSDDAQAGTAAMTRLLVDTALAHGGSYYLTYQLYPTVDQLLRAYPNAARAFERKRFYDPDEIFTSLFYERYRNGLADAARPR